MRTKIEVRSEIEEKIIEATYQQYINSNIVLADKIIDDLISKYPEYYQLRLVSADLKNDLKDPYAKDSRYAEILSKFQFISSIISKSTITFSS